MRKLIFQMMVSLDGFYEGPGGDISWHKVDGAFNDYSIELLNNLDILLFGRITYELMAAYWPTDTAVQNEPVVAGKMNDLQKIVFSRTLSEEQIGMPGSRWKNVKLVKDRINEEVAALKKEVGRDMAIFGSSQISLSFIDAGLIDEYRLIVSPVILADGKRLFEGLKNKLELQLQRSTTFSSGNVLLYYYPSLKQ
jgi:dihydrofolate reductase